MSKMSDTNNPSPILSKRFKSILSPTKKYTNKQLSSQHHPDKQQRQYLLEEKTRPLEDDLVASTSIHSYGNDQPSSSTLNDLHRVLDLVSQERHLVAYSLYQNIKARLAGIDQNLNSDHPEFKINEDSKTLLRENRKVFKILEQRVELFQDAQRNVQLNNDWTISHQSTMVKSYYRREKDGSLSMKIEGELHNAALFEQIAVIREIDLFHTWAPFCKSSRKLAQLSRTDAVGWMLVGAPHFGLSRDACFRAMGCNSIYEDGTIIIVGKGVDDESELQHQQEDNNYEYNHDSKSEVTDKSDCNFLLQDDILSTIDIPPEPKGFGSARMKIKTFHGVIHILSPTSARTTIIANLDPKIEFLPQFIIDFIMKKMVHVLLYRLQDAANMAALRPHQSPHAQRIADDSSFYKHWLLPQLQQFCASKGWDIPVINSYDNEIMMNQYDNYVHHHNKTMQNGSIARCDTRSEPGYDFVEFSTNSFEDEREIKKASSTLSAHSESSMFTPQQQKRLEELKKFSDQRSVAFQLSEQSDESPLVTKNLHEAHYASKIQLFQSNAVEKIDKSYIPNQRIVLLLYLFMLNLMYADYPMIFVNFIDKYRHGTLKESINHLDRSNFVGFMENAIIFLVTIFGHLQLIIIKLIWYTFLFNIFTYILCLSIFDECLKSTSKTSLEHFRTTRRYFEDRIRLPLILFSVLTTTLAVTKILIIAMVETSFYRLSILLSKLNPIPLIIHVSNMMNDSEWILIRHINSSLSSIMSIITYTCTFVWFVFRPILEFTRVLSLVRYLHSWIVIEFEEVGWATIHNNIVSETKMWIINLSTFCLICGLVGRVLLVKYDMNSINNALLPNQKGVKSTENGKKSEGTIVQDNRLNTEINIGSLPSFYEMNNVVVDDDSSSNHSHDEKRLLNSVDDYSSKVSSDGASSSKSKGISKNLKNKFKGIGVIKKKKGFATISE